MRGAGRVKQAISKFDGVNSPFHAPDLFLYPLKT